jgi:hypothetical protein
MPKQDKYTLDEAKQYASEIGKAWTPALEQQLRSMGKIVDAPKSSAADQLKMAFESLAQYVPGNYGYDPREKLTTGTTSPDQYGAEFARQLTANMWNPDVPAPANTTQKVFGGLGGASGAIAPITLTGGMGAATSSRLIAGEGLKEVAARRLLASGLGLGLYGAAHPGTAEEKFNEFSSGTRTGMVMSALPEIPGIRKVASIPNVGRPLVDAAMFTGLGLAEGQSPTDALIGGVTNAIPAQALHYASGDIAPRAIPKSRVEAAKNIARERLAAQMEAQRQQTMEYPERLRAEQFRAVRAGEASPFPNPQMRWEADYVRQHNEQVLRESVLQQEAGAAHNAQRGARARQLEQQQVRVNGQRGAADQLAAQMEAQRQAEVAARLEGVAAGREANLAKPVEYPRDPMAGPVSPTKGKPGAAVTNTIPQDATAPGRRGGMGMAPAEATRPKPKKAPTLDMMGGQQLYEWMRDGIKAAGERRAASEQQKINDLADKMVADTARGARIPGLEDFHGKIKAPPMGTQAGATPGMMSGRLEPIEGNAVTVPAVAYVNGDMPLSAAIKAISDPAMAATSPDVVRQLGLNSQPGTPGFDNAPKPVKVGKAELWRLDRVRAIRRASGGAFNTPATKESLRVGQIFELFTNKMNAELQQGALDALDRSGLKHDSPDLRVVSEFLDKAHKIDRPVSISANTVEGQKILSKAQNPEAVLQLAGEMADNLATQARYRDFTRKSQGLPPVRRQGGGMSKGGYWPHTERRYSLTGKGHETALDKIREIGRAIEQRTRTTEEAALDPNNETNLWSAREQSRNKEGLLTPEQINYDLLDVIAQYSTDTARMVGHTQARQHGSNVAEAMRERAKMLRSTDVKASMEWERAADIIKTVTDVAYGGKRIGPDKFFYQLGNMNPAFKGAMTTDAAIKQAFNSSRYAGNLRFMLLTQWSSVFMAGAQGKLTPQMIGEAMREAGTKRIHDEWVNAYSHYAKNQKYATVGNESNPMVDRGNDLINNRRRGKIQKASDLVDYGSQVPTNAIENATGRIAFSLAEQLAKRAIANGEPLTPQDVAQFKSDFVGLTQSYYDRVNRAPMLNAPFLNTAFPAQGFPLEALNSLGDIRRGTMGPKMTGTVSKGDRALIAGQFLAASYLMNMLVTLTTSDEETTAGKLKENLGNTATTFMPFSALYLPDVAKYMPESVQPYIPKRYADTGKPYQQNLAKNVVASVAKMANGDVSGGLVDLGSNFVKAGAQIKRIFDTNRQIEEKKIPESERIQGMAWGPSATPTGKANRRKTESARSGKRKTPYKQPEPR